MRMWIGVRALVCCFVFNELHRQQPWDLKSHCAISMTPMPWTAHGLKLAWYFAVRAATQHEHAHIHAMPGD